MLIGYWATAGVPCNCGVTNEKIETLLIDSLNKTCSDTLYLVNGNKKVVTYVKQNKKRVLFKNCTLLGSKLITSSIRKNDVHKVVLSSGEEINFNELLTKKERNKKVALQVLKVMGLILGIIAVSVGLILLLYVIFPPW